MILDKETHREILLVGLNQVVVNWSLKERAVANELIAGIMEVRDAVSSAIVSADPRQDTEQAEHDRLLKEAGIDTEHPAAPV